MPPQSAQTAKLKCIPHVMTQLLIRCPTRCSVCSMLHRWALIENHPQWAPSSMKPKPRVLRRGGLSLLRSIFTPRQEYKFVDQDGLLVFVRSSDGAVIESFGGEEPSVPEHLFEHVFGG
jgi:hypothetical protein